MFRDLAISITENAKGNALLSALSHGFKKAVELGAAEKTIIFTESRKTQNYLIDLLSENGYRDKIDLIFGAMTDSGRIVPEETARRFFDLPVKDISTKETKSTKALKEEVSKRKQAILAELATKQANWFEEEIEKLNFWADDKRKGLKSELKEFDDQIAVLKKEARLAGNLPDKLAIQKKLRDIDKKRDAAWKEYDNEAKLIEKQKDELLDSVEERLKQTIEEKTIFTINWSVV